MSAKYKINKPEKLSGEDFNNLTKEVRFFQNFNIPKLLYKNRVLLRKISLFSVKICFLTKLYTLCRS